MVRVLSPASVSQRVSLATLRGPAEIRGLRVSKVSRKMKGMKTITPRAPQRRTQWDRALTCPLPRTISYELLDTLRTDVIGYLDWVTHTMLLSDREGALTEIQRVADRITRIAAMTPAALERGIEEGRLRMSDDVPF